MPTLPVSGYFSNLARTEIEMRTAFDDQRDVIAQMLGSPIAIESLTIAGGVITPTQGYISVDTEGGAGTDDLVTIQTTNLPEGSLILMRPTGSRDIVVKSSGGNITSPWGDFTLTGISDIMSLIRDGANWRVLRVSRSNIANQRSDLGLGTAAIEDVGAGNGLDADLLDGLHAAAFLLVAAKAADSDLLDGLDSTVFARKDLAALQDFNGNVQSSWVLGVDDPTTSTPVIRLYDNGVRRGEIFFEGGTNTFVFRLYQSDGSTLECDIRLTSNGELQLDAGAGYVDIVNSSNEVRADLFGDPGYTIPNLPIKASNAIAGVPGTGYVTGALDEDNRVKISLNRFSFFPSIEGGSQGHWIQMVLAYHTPGGDHPTAPKFGLWNRSDITRTYHVSWEYLT